MMNPIALRMDDIGASSKKFEIYSKHLRGFGNFLFLKYIPPFASWGPYHELTAHHWGEIIEVLIKTNAKLTVGITACWVEYEGNLIPFNEKFPEVIPLIREGVKHGVLEIASHGLTHCVLQDNLFRPKLFKSNRTFHREFWDWLPKELHYDHVTKSKNILESIFESQISTLIPPGNVFSDDTINAAISAGYERINCNLHHSYTNDKIKIIGNDYVLPFHDREIVKFGVNWLRNTIEKHRNHQFVFVRDLE